MGSQVSATCQCGLRATTLIGGGMFNFETMCCFPCLCERCRTVVEVNLLAKQRRCPQCNSKKVVPYDDPALCERAGDSEVASWNIPGPRGRELTLTNGNYRCPQCGQMTLRFINTGLCFD